MNRGVPIVLLIEHEPIQSVNLARVLKDGGYSVIPVSRANDALEIFVTHHMDIALVVADTQAAISAGPPLVGALHDINPHVPVVAMSPAAAMTAGAAMTPGAAVAAAAAGRYGEQRRNVVRYPNVVATLTKPVAAADLVAHVQRALQPPRAESPRLAHIRPVSLAREAAEPTRGTTVFSAASTPFSWPPSEEELDDIQVLDTRVVPTAGPDAAPLTNLRHPPPARHLELASRTPPPPPTAPPTAPPAIEKPAVVPATAAAIRPARVVRPETVVQPAPLMQPDSTARPVPLMPPLQPATWVQPVPPVRLVARRRDWRPRALRQRFTEADRWVAAAAIALFGLTLTTMLEWRGVPLKRALVGDLAPTTAPAAMLAGRGYQPGTTTLVPAQRVRSQIVAARMPSAFDSQIASHTRLATALPPGPRSNASRRGTAESPRLTPRPTTRLAKSSDPPRSAPARSDPAPDSRTPRTVMSAAPAAPLPRTPSTHDVEATDARNAPVDPAATGDAAASRATTAAREAAASTNVVTPPASRTQDDERGIYRVLQQYERAYERLDVAAARAVWPSLNTRALARAFDGLKEQALEFSHCRVAMAPREATAICGGRASYVPRVGHQTARTEPREWTFRLQKVKEDWLIAKAEVR